MQVVSPRYLSRSGRHAIIDALTLELQSWFATMEPLSAELLAIVRQLDSKPTPLPSPPAEQAQDAQP